MLLLDGGGHSGDLSDGSGRRSGGGRRWKWGGEGDGASEELRGVEDDELRGGGDLGGDGLDVGVGEGPGLARDGGGDTAPDGGHAVPEGSQTEEGGPRVPVRSAAAAHDGVSEFAARHGQRRRGRGSSPRRDGAAARAGDLVAPCGVHHQPPLPASRIGTTRRALLLLTAEVAAFCVQALLHL